LEKVMSDKTILFPEKFKSLKPDPVLPLVTLHV
jgi:hypothetical protein